MPMPIPIPIAVLVFVALWDLGLGGRPSAGPSLSPGLGFGPADRGVAGGQRPVTRAGGPVWAAQSWGGSVREA